MTEADDESFLGRGWSFPAGLSKTGDIALAADVEDIQQAITIILGTAQGERIMRPDFGAGLQALVFEPINTTTMALVRHRVEEALINWEPRIDRITVQVTADPPQGRLMVEIGYRVRTTNTFYNLVYPFYLLEDKRT
jgi:uncharacterized protein